MMKIKAGQPIKFCVSDIGVLGLGCEWFMWRKPDEMVRFTDGDAVWQHQATRKAYPRLVNGWQHLFVSKDEWPIIITGPVKINDEVIGGFRGVLAGRAI